MTKKKKRKKKVQGQTEKKIIMRLSYIFIKKKSCAKKRKHIIYFK